MHVKLQQAEAELTDSMKMFKWGLEGGKPAAGKIGVQPEWFYKGDGRCVVAPGQPLELPAYALDGGDEVEVVGLYVVADDGTPWRVGFALGNEYADHVMERQNYSTSLTRSCASAAADPSCCRCAAGERAGSAGCCGGRNRSDEWLSGEDNMAHSIANLEHHHFKYADFRRPGDVHVHFFGVATGSFTKNVKAAPGDVFEIACPAFGRPLRNPLAAAREAGELVPVRAL
jgi:hypothetical protein